MIDKPKFPIKVHFHEDDTIWVLNNEEELASNLEWFDSHDSNENASVRDANGCFVRIKVESLEVIEFFLEGNKRGQPGAY